MVYANDQMQQQQQYQPPNAGQVAGSLSQSPGQFGAPAPNGPPGQPIYGQGDPQYAMLTQLLQQIFGPQLGQSGAQSNDLINQIMQSAGLSQQQYGLNTQQAQQDYGFGMANLGIQQGQQGIEMGALQRQAGLIPQYQDLANQGFGLQRTQAQESAGNQTRDVWLNTASQQRGLNSNLTSSGAYTSVGGDQQRSDIATRGTNAVGDIQQQLQNSLQGIGIQQQQSNLNFTEQIASNKDSQAQLGLMSKQLGISAQEISTRLQDTLAQLGLSNQITGDQFFQEIANIQNGQFGPLTNIVTGILSQSGLTIPTGG